MTTFGGRQASLDASSPKKTALVIGANRGIGLQLVKTFQDHGWKVYGSVRPITRDDSSVQDLKNTGAGILYVDYTNEASIEQAAREFGDGPLDCLVNSGGFGVNPDDSWSHDYDMVLERFKVMCLGPFLATKHFRPSLERSEAGKVLNISSDMGSIATNTEEGENIGYRVAKAALNQQTKTLAQELRRTGSKISLVAVCPGFVATKMTRFRGKDDIVEVCKGTVDIVLNLTTKDSGSFRNWKGAYIPW